MTRQLFTYFRSTAAYRVRIALHYKGLSFDSLPIHLVKEGGEQFSAAYARINTQPLVPSLMDDVEWQPLTQSMAILEYLDERYPEPALLPQDPFERAQARALAQTVACDIHPLNNLRVLKYLTGPMNLTAEQKQTWYAHWIQEGFRSIENALSRRPRGGLFCFGDKPTFADLCLVPQIYNARRFNIPLDDFPLIVGVETHCLAQSYFQEALPENQPDAP